MQDADTPGSAPRRVADNIAEIVRLEAEAVQRRSFADRVSDQIAGFIGTIEFVVLHLAGFALWAVVNAGLIPWVRPFDPYPFILLAMIVSLEGVLLSTFVLIKQNRMAARADERDHLGLQVSLLSEQEITKVIQMLERITAQLGIEGAVIDDEAREMGHNTAVANLADELRERLSAAEPGRPARSGTAPART